MSKGRFTYLKPRDVEERQAVQPEPQQAQAEPTTDAPPAQLQTVARGAGRMQQDREQLNVRLPVALKRQVAARAALEGVTVGELLERVLLEYLAQPLADC